MADAAAEAAAAGGDGERLRAAVRLLEASPPGQLPEVARALRAALGGGEGSSAPGPLLAAAAAAAFPAHNRRHFLSAPHEGRRVLVTAAGRVGAAEADAVEEEFLDPGTRTVFTFDHVRQAVVSARPAGPGEAVEGEVEKFRAALEAGFRAYAGAAIPAGTVAVYAKIADQGEWAFTICVGALVKDAENLWVGHSRSMWTVEVAKKTVAALEGYTALAVRFFEGGNAAVDFRKEYNKDLAAFDGVDGFVRKVVGFIELCDKKFVKDLEGEFSGFAEESFKDLRRALPYSGQKMNWSSDSHSMAKELKRREDELAAQEQQPAGEPGAGDS